MKKAIDYLKTLGIKCDKDGKIISKLPVGERGITLVNMLEDKTGYTIVNDKLQKQDA